MTNQANFTGRRHFMKTTSVLAGSLFLPDTEAFFGRKKVKVSAHLWVYASKYPPNWDCTPTLEQAFSDLNAAGYAGIELMNILLEAEDAVPRIAALSKKYSLPVTGCSYGANMWNQAKHAEILENVTKIVGKLQQLGGVNFGVSVGTAKRKKTTEELDAQADLLKKIIPICTEKGITLNLHNHTYEVENDMHDLKGTLARIPDVKLGPDLNWLVRGGVDPVWFINTYGQQIVYMHIRDQKSSGKWAEAVGEGVTDFPAIAKALKQLRYKGHVAVELAFDEPTTRPVLESWTISRQYVKKTFNW